MTPRDEVDLLCRTNPVAMGLIAELAQRPTAETATEVLALLEPVSELEFIHVPALLDARTQSLHVLGRDAESSELQYRYLLKTEDSYRWAKRGRMVQDLIIEQPERRDAVIADLRAMCTKIPAPVPRLLLAFALLRHWGADDPANEQVDRNELQELYAAALQPLAWADALPYAHRWVEHIASGIGTLVAIFTAIDRRHEAKDIARAALRFPFERGDLDESGFGSLAATYFGLGLDSAVVELCNRMLRAHRSWGAPHHWLGCAKAMAGKGSAAAHHFRASIPSACVEPGARLAACEVLLDLGEPAVALELLQTLQPTSSNRADHVKAIALRKLDRWEEALSIYESLRDSEPESLALRAKIGEVLVQLGRLEEAESEFRACLDDDSSPANLTARSFLMAVLRANGKTEDALEMHQWFLHPERAHVLKNDDFRARFSGSYAQTLAAAGRIDEALEHYRQAIELEPTERIVYQYAVALLELNRVNEADEALRACGLLEGSKHLRYLQLHVDDRLQRWQALLDGLPPLEDWLREHKLGRNVLALRMRALVMTYRPLEAVIACEADLAEVIADPLLSQLRRIALDAVHDQMKALQNLAGQQDERVRAEQQQSRRELAEVKGRSLRLVTEIRRLEKDRETLRLMDRKPPQNAVGTREREQLPVELRGKLPSDVIALLAAAEAAWNHLARDADHAPVVVQHARALESVLLRSVCRPLLAIAREQGVDVEPRQAAKLSLGEAAILLAGDTPTALPCASGPLWHAALETFWSTGARAVCTPEQRGWLRRTAPTLVQTIAKTRNEAAHGATLISRASAGRVRTLVLGEHNASGMLVSIHAMGMALVNKQP